MGVGLGGRGGMAALNQWGSNFCPSSGWTKKIFQAGDRGGNKNKIFRKYFDFLQENIEFFGRLRRSGGEQYYIMGSTRGEWFLDLQGGVVPPPPPSPYVHIWYGVFCLLTNISASHKLVDVYRHTRPPIFFSYTLQCDYCAFVSSKTVCMSCSL